MNDRQFDKATAIEWIEIIEGNGNKVREADLYPYLRNWLIENKPKSILDVGCGQGACVSQIDLNHCSYTGVDPSIFLLERAQQLYSNPRAQFISGNAYSLPFNNGHFDAAFSIAVWHLLENKEGASQELSRVLRDNGNFLIVAANPESYEAWTATYAKSKRDGLRFEGTNYLADGSESTDVLFLHSFDEIVGYLKKSGLEVEQTQKFRTALALRGRKIKT